MVLYFFKQKSAYEMRISDWSSDVCSSDLRRRGGRTAAPGLVPQADVVAGEDDQRAQQDLQLEGFRIEQEAGESDDRQTQELARHDEGGVGLGEGRGQA